MENIHLTSTNKPSILIFDREENRLLPLQDEPVFMEHQDLVENQNIHITNDEYIGLSYYLDGNLVRKGVVDDKEYWEVRKGYKKIILTTDPQLIADGIQAIDEEFLQWFVKNPTCKVVKIDLIPINEFGSDITLGSYGFDKFKYKIIIPQEEPKLETLEEAAERLYPTNIILDYDTNEDIRMIWTDAAKWQAERMYSEEEVRIFFKHAILFKEESVSTCEEAIEAEFSMLVKQFKKK
jgi:hypothetical protein